MFIYFVKEEEKIYIKTFEEEKKGALSQVSFEKTRVQKSYSCEMSGEMPDNGHPMGGCLEGEHLQWGADLHDKGQVFPQQIADKRALHTSEHLQPKQKSFNALGYAHLGSRHKQPPPPSPPAPSSHHPAS